MSHLKKDLAAAVFFCLSGLAFAATSASTLPTGTVFQMGPGYFPFISAAILIGIGLIILAGALRIEQGLLSVPNWRPVVLISASPILFAITITGLGLVPATALTVGMAAYASHRTNVVSAFILSVTLTFFCVAVFVYALQIPLVMFGPWVSY